MCGSPRSALLYTAFKVFLYIEAGGVPALQKTSVLDQAARRQQANHVYLRLLMNESPVLCFIVEGFPALEGQEEAAPVDQGHLQVLPQLNDPRQQGLHTHTHTHTCEWGASEQHTAIQPYSSSSSSFSI